MSNMKNYQRPKENRKEWKQPVLIDYGDINSLTRQACNPNLPNCKPKVLGLRDDFSNNISTLN